MPTTSASAVHRDEIPQPILPPTASTLSGRQSRASSAHVGSRTTYMTRKASSASQIKNVSATLNRKATAAKKSAIKRNSLRSNPKNISTHLVVEVRVSAHLHVVCKNQLDFDNEHNFLVGHGRVLEPTDRAPTALRTAKQHAHTRHKAIKHDSHAGRWVCDGDKTKNAARLNAPNQPVWQTWRCSSSLDCTHAQQQGPTPPAREPFEPVRRT